MGLAARLDRLVPDLAATLARFPVPAALAGLLCLYVNVAGLGGSSDEFGNVAAGAAAAFLAAGAAHLFAEGRGAGRGFGILLAAAAAAAAALIGYFTSIFATSYLFLFAGLIPVVMIAPFLHEGARPAALWLFNLRFGLAALLAAVVAALFAAGLSVIVEALNFLFEAGISGDLHEHIWGTAMTLVAPVYGLSLMPQNLTEEVDIASQRGTLLERGVSVLVNYVLVPVILVYALILHAYAVKIVLERDLPKGQIGLMVSVFALGGTGAWLIAWPWREQGTRLLRWFMAGWFWLTIVPAVLLVIAIARRVADYGVTPDRYGIALIAVWVAGLSLYLAIRRNRADLRAILGGIAVLLIVGSAGPFGANGLTIASQTARLAHLLEANGMLKDGKAVPPAGKLDSRVASEGYSILGTLKDAGGLERLAPWFAGEAKDPFLTGDTGWGLYSGIATWLGFQSPQYAGDYLSFNANVPLSLELPPGARLVGPLQAERIYDKQAPQKTLTALFDDVTLTVKLSDASYSIAVRQLLERAKAGATGTANQPPLRLPLAPGADLLIDNIYGTLGDTPSLGSLRFWLVVTGGA